MLDTVVDGLVTIDRHGTIQSFNKACVTLFGYDARRGGGAAMSTS